MKKTLKYGMLASAMGVMVGMAGEAGAVTFDLSTLNLTREGSKPPYSYGGGTDPVSGTTIFSASGGQQNAWSEGTGAGAAAIEFQSTFGEGNNSSKVYVGSGGPGFSLPGTGGVAALSGTETSVGANNSLYSGVYSLGNGFPFYFLFVNSSLTAPGSATLNSFYISATSSPLEVIGLNGTANTGGTVIDSQLISASTTTQKVTLNWTGVTEIDILSATSGSYFGYGATPSGFYVNDIEANDPVPTPEPGTMVLLGLGMAGLAVYGKRRNNNKA
jgi:hypothetical protein